MLLIEIATLWILVIPVTLVAGLYLSGRVLSMRADRRRQAALAIWAGAHDCDARPAARPLTRRPEHPRFEPRRRAGRPLSQR